MAAFNALGGDIEISPIASVSPTLAETLSVCMLRAGLLLVRGISRYVLGNPKAWLGTAYHEVLAAATKNAATDFDRAVKDAWHDSINKQYQRASLQPLDARFGPPDRWPGYYLVFAMAMERAKKLRSGSPVGSVGAGAGKTAPHEICEEQLSSYGGRLVGKPDLVKDNAVIDFKTGSIFESEDPETIKAAYVRQLRLYAFLVHAQFGWWPKYGRLLPMDGAPVEIELDPSDCQAESELAIALLNQFNTLLADTTDAESLGSPSPKNCRWCPFQVLCPSFWDTADPTWEDEMGSIAVRGELLAEPLKLGTGAYQVLISVTVGMVAPSTLEIGGLSPSIYPSVQDGKVGTGVRITALVNRPDGSISATKRTIIMHEADIPRVRVASSGGQDVIGA